MKVDNPMSSEFLLRYPVEAARVLEQVSTEYVVALLQEIPTKTATAVVIAMLPNIAAACLGKMETTRAAHLLNDIPVTRAARIYRLINPEKQQEISSKLSAKYRMRIRRLLSYTSLSAGDFMNPNVDMLPDNLTVGDAIRHIERYRQPVKCEIYVVDNSHRFLGVVDLGKLLTAKQHIRLRHIMTRKVLPVSVHAGTEKILDHKGWANRLRLPVVDSENILVGILDYARVRGTVDSDITLTRDPMENVLSLATLYWLSMMQLLESILNITAIKKRGSKL
ncbi:magnesium transporter MgtE N-terminal domain-containing protein [Kaarinaea lacus]